jgi:ZIP family zinc transporter
MTENALVITVSLVSGVVGTTIGGILGLLLKNRSRKLNASILSFAGGVMLGVVGFEMVPEGVALCVVRDKGYTGVLICLASLLLGVALIYFVNKLIMEIENGRSGVQISGVCRPFYCKFNNSAAVLTKDADSQKSLRRAGIVMMIAIAVHNLPEGIAIGASGAVEAKTGIIVAIIIALHDIPEGTAVAAPLVGGGVSAAKSLFLTFLSGLTTVVGALIGLFAGGINKLSSGICLAFAGGAMLYVTFLEILPEAHAMNENKTPAAPMLAGYICAMLIVYLV